MFRAICFFALIALTIGEPVQTSKGTLKDARLLVSARAPSLLSLPTSIRPKAYKQLLAQYKYITVVRLYLHRREVISGNTQRFMGPLKLTLRFKAIRGQVFENTVLSFHHIVCERSGSGRNRYPSI